jgi:hypothetical protein
MNVRRLLRAALACLLWSATCGLAWANNNLFLPGDAFFPTELTAEEVAALHADPDNPPMFKYSNLGGYQGAFCGYAGYGQAKIPSLDAAFIANLKKAHARIRRNEPRRFIEIDRDGTTELVETNPIRVLFYPPDFDFPRFKIGLQYNEDWVAETVKFGHPPKHTRLCCLVEDAEAVMQSWRDSTFVPGLDASLPDVELKPVPQTDDPITINGPVKAIVLGSRDPLTEYFAPEDFSVSLLIVNSNGITEMAYEEEWKTYEADE